MMFEGVLSASARRKPGGRKKLQNWRNRQARHSSTKSAPSFVETGVHPSGLFPKECWSGCSLIFCSWFKIVTHWQCLGQRTFFVWMSKSPTSTKRRSIVSHQGLPLSTCREVCIDGTPPLCKRWLQFSTSAEELQGDWLHSWSWNSRIFDLAMFDNLW